MLNDRCNAGNADAPRLIADRIDFMRDLVAAGLLSEGALTGLEAFESCSEMMIQPDN